ncbi:MAG: TonB-dependent receptor [Planctomycetota bacterium]
MCKRTITAPLLALIVLMQVPNESASQGLSGLANQAMSVGAENLTVPEDRSSSEGTTRQTTGEGLRRDERFSRLFGDVNQLDALPEIRRPKAASPGANAVFSAEATGRKTADVGSLLQQTKGAQGVAVQHRTPIISDTRVRGQRVGQVLASGSYWAPARMDLDTMMSKIDSRLIEDVILIKGPYAARYGPSFRFVDIEFIKSPRYDRFTTHGSTSASYTTNGEHWYGRQSVWGGNENYGFHVSYGHQTANDYQTGQSGFSLPSSFKSRDLFVAMGWDLSPHESLEFNLLRLDQTDVEFPGLVYDINFLVTDGYEATYRNTRAWWSDQFQMEVWYNRTRFEGDTERPGKARQIPNLQTVLESPSGNNGFARTDVDALSAGYRMENFYELANGYLTLGTDLILVNQELNDIEPLGRPNDNNFPVPRSHSIDVGFYLEDVEQVTDRLSMTAGGRLDGVFADAANRVRGVPASFTTIKQSELDQAFFMGAAYLTAQYDVSPTTALNAGLGFANRAPTLTELYADSAFIGSLQRGITFLLGDPTLRQEKLYQMDLALNYRNGNNQFGVQSYLSWIEDYITYDLLDPPGDVDGFQQGALFVNTDLARIWGLEFYAQRDLTDITSVFATSSYTQGTDLTRTDPARLSVFDTRSSVSGVEQEALPGIPPLDTRIGILLEDPRARPEWGVEISARIVDNQDRFAATLEEVATPGFTTYDIRAYRAFSQWLFTFGIENFTDKFYQEHIDYRTGRGVFRPGIAGYLSAEVSY